MPDKPALFDLVVDAKRVHPSFESLRTSSGSAPARWMLSEVYEGFTDPDGNFLEQFQSTGFDARFFELYLHAYFTYTGFSIDRSHNAPDFLVSRGGVTAAVEVTTVNPPTAGVLAELGKNSSELSGLALTEYLRHELPIRFGSPLFTKLARRYWELPHCRGLPFVLAIEAFHDADSLAFTDAALTGYLYGLASTANWNAAGELEIEFTRIYSHVVGEKEIPSSFFDQPGTENISAVVFTNSGTTAKFTRMGYQFGVGNDTIELLRSGFCLNEERTARDPTLFQYNLDEPPLVEPWGQGMVVLHNPRAVHPLPIEFFRHCAQTILDDGYPHTLVQGWHPFSSKTVIIDLGEIKKAAAKLPPRGSFAVGAVSKAEFRSISRSPEPSEVFEEGWFVDESMSFLGVVFFYPGETNWGSVIMARDEYFDFHGIDSASGFASRNDARLSLQLRMIELLSRPQRLFKRVVSPAANLANAADTV